MFEAEMAAAESQEPNNKTQARGKKAKTKTSVDQMIKKKKSGMDDDSDESDGFKPEKKAAPKKKASDDTTLKKIKKEPKISQDSVETVNEKEVLIKPATKAKPRKISNDSDELDTFSNELDESIISPKKKAKVLIV